MTTDPSDSSSDSSGKTKQMRLFLLSIVLVVIVLVFYFDLASYINLDNLRENRELLTDFVQDNYLLAIIITMSIYAVAIALSLPGGLLMSVTVGFLFGPWVGTGVVVVSATIGATLLFLLARGILGKHFARRLGPWMARVEDGFRANAFSYILALRLIPAIPFSVLNPIPALFGVPVGTYVAATFLGIIPGSFVFVLAGEGLGSILDQGGELTAASILTPQMLLSLVGLGILALLPVVVKQIKKRRKSAV